MKKIGYAALALLPAAAWALPQVSETLELTNGWNAVYIESTPANPLCEDFFRGTPVVAAAAYLSGADAATAQYDEDGGEIVQAPVAYLTWVRGENASTLQSIAGGGTFVLYATNATTISFTGVPAVPKMTWRKVSSSETNESFNVAGVSSASKEVSILDYFGEGPFGTSTAGRSICSIGGDSTDEGPVLKNAAKGAFGRALSISGGKAYALTAVRAGDWPGVIGVHGGPVVFGAEGNYSSFKVQNCGTTNHTFSISMVRSASGEEPPPVLRRLPRTAAIGDPGFTNVVEAEAWTVELAPGEISEQIFCIDRSRIEAGTEYGAILVVEDPWASKMRVRIPIAAAAAKAGAVAYPAGLWAGTIALSRVSGIGDATPEPVQAGGTLKMNVMVHVGADGRCTLLQRVVAGIGTNGARRLFQDLSGVPPDVENARRFSTVMMSVDTPAVAAAAGSKFGDSAGFAWTVGAKARDNPFRHAWHPDHDGKKADYSGDAPSGDDFANYAQPVKPELWSVANRLEFSWHEGGDGGKPANFPYNPGETTSGVVTWEVSGLSAKGPIKSAGTFTLRRVFAAPEIE